ncbi:DUF6191 domain-containing protein [Streptomyces sp. NBC_01020]|uniref:DUF6191 domain-containing protein n=1 Tax=Streptomyces sp. NBC_01020 TaxID=2903722 RepID=UPI003867397D|nr:DUF6191 domain-containing protein [Streptomyces sp. NBC_01020]
MFNLIEQLFAPGRKHTEDENKRLELSRVDLNDGDPGRGPIDLDSGTVIIRSQEQDQSQDRDEEQEQEQEQDRPASES